MTRRHDETVPLRDPDRPRPTPRAPYTARCYRLLPDPPTLPDPRAAALYLAVVRDLLAATDWTRAERATLCRLERRWARRVTGHDARWNALGTRHGRTPTALEATLRRPDPAWIDRT